MYRIRTAEVTEANSSEISALDEAQTRSALESLLNTPYGNLSEQTYEDYIGFAEQSIIPRIRERYVRTAPRHYKTKRVHYHHMVSEIEDFSRYFAGETHQEIAATGNRNVEDVETSVRATFTALMDETGDGGRTFRREYHEQNPGFRANEFPGLLHAIRYAKPKRGRSAQATGESADFRGHRRNTGDTSHLDSMGHYLARIDEVALINAEQEVELSKRIEAGLVAAHALEQFGSVLSQKETEELEWLAQDGKDAKEHFYLANLRLVFSLARRYPQRRSMTIEDLVQEGNFGLMRAVEKFDYTKGFKFSTYATPWIKQFIQRAMMEKDDMIRKPVHVAEEIRKVNGIENALMGQGIEATSENIAERLGWDVERVEDLLEWRKAPASLDAPLGESGKRFGGETSLLALVAEGELETEAVEQIDKSAILATIRNHIGALDDREADIILSRYGLRTGRKETFREVAERYGLSAERIRQLESEALATVRRAARAEDLEGISA